MSYLKRLSSEYEKALRLESDVLTDYLDLADALWDQGCVKEALNLLSTAKEKFIVQRSIIGQRISRISESEDFWKEVVLAMTLSSETGPDGSYCGHERSEKALEEKLWQYADGSMSEREEEMLWNELSGCRYCLVKLVQIQSSIRRAQAVPAWSKKKIAAVLAKWEREKKLQALLGALADLIDRVSHPRKDLKTLFDRQKAILKKAFAYPPPAFAPVFGEAKPTVLSPYGSVRYPIAFEWSNYDGADQYKISIPTLGWSINTAATKVQLNERDLTLAYGEEYMWKLQALKAGRVIEEENGFISLITKKELENIVALEAEIPNIEAGNDRLILWGGALQSSGLLMEAIDKYKMAYEERADAGVAYLIACCYDQLELEELRDVWNNKTLRGSPR